ncbi:MAG: Spy/CpxP family protein refolding chaperone [Candidatus Poribacteria bacterium]
MRHPEKPPRSERGCGEHPHPKTHHGHPHPPFLASERREHEPRPPRGHPPRHPEWAPHDFDFYLFLTEELSLSEEQVKQLQNIRVEFEKNEIMSKARIKVAEVELQELLDQPEVERDKVDAKIREIGAMKIEFAINDVHAMLDAREVLTPEQKEKLKKLRPIPYNSTCCF